MAIVDRVKEPFEASNMHDGKGKTLGYQFFQGEISPNLMFFDLVFEPGAYAGHHRHNDNVEILYIISGKAESCQDGKCQVVEAGDAILIKSGESHAIKNIGNQVLHTLGFVAGVNDDIGSVDNLPPYETMNDW